MSNDLAIRRIEPEILDGLSPGDPRAIASRRDLVHINALMFHPSIMARLLREHVKSPPRRILEIGAGDGLFMLKVARRLAKRWQKVELVLLDRSDLVSRSRRDDFAKLGWQVEFIAADIFEWLPRSKDQRFDAITANLFLHHFDDAALARLFTALQPLASVFLASEPRRSGFALAASQLLWAIGANDVSRHDAPASVRAGFTGSELSRLWPAGQSVVEERKAGLFTHVFAAGNISRSA